MKKFDKVVEKVEKAIVEDILERYNHPSYWDFDLLHETTYDAIQEVYGYDDDEKIDELIVEVVETLEKKSH